MISNVNNVVIGWCDQSCYIILKFDKMKLFKLATLPPS